MKLEDLEVRHVEILILDGNVIVRGVIAVKNFPDDENNRHYWDWMLGPVGQVLSTAKMKGPDEF